MLNTEALCKGKGLASNPENKVNMLNMISLHSTLLDMGIISCIFNPVVLCLGWGNRLEVEQWNREEREHTLQSNKPHTLGLADCGHVYVFVIMYTAVHSSITTEWTANCFCEITQANKHNSSFLCKGHFHYTSTDLIFALTGVFHNEEPSKQSIFLLSSAGCCSG